MLHLSSDQKDERELAREGGVKGTPGNNFDKGLWGGRALGHLKSLALGSIA